MAERFEKREPCIFTGKSSLLRNEAPVHCTVSLALETPQQRGIEREYVLIACATQMGFPAEENQMVRVK